MAPQYDVWNTLIPNLLVDISSLLPSKRQLMQVFASQLNKPNRHYIESILSLNCYRGMPHMVDYAKGYTLTNAEQFMSFQKPGTEGTHL
jgi:hypothetical protein